MPKNGNGPQAADAAYQARIEAHVAAFCARHQLLPASGTVVVAVSGGADSLCLLGVLARLTAAGSQWPRVRLVVAHLDHGLRGTESAADAQFVCEAAERIGVPCRVGRSDVAALARVTRRGLEDAARRARYAFLREIAAAEDAQRICTGHTENDQLETLVMRWLRGSGLTGLTGMRPLARDIARPLLCLTRDQSHRYCTARGWTWREDATNDDPSFWRNRIRRDVLPVLLQENPNLRATLVRTSRALALDDAFLQEAAEHAWTAVVRVHTTDEVALDRAALGALHPAIRSRVLRRAAASLTASEPSLGWAHVEMLQELVDHGATRRRLTLPGAMSAYLTEDTFVLGRRPPAAGSVAAQVEPEEVTLPVPGSVHVPTTRWRVSAEVLDAGAGAAPPGAEVSTYGSDYVRRDMLRPPIGTAESVGRAQMRAYLDADLARLPLRVRTWRPGDRFRPLGMAGEKKLQDYFVDARVPREERVSIPLVFCADHLIWVAGHRLDDRVRIRPETQRVLALRLEPLPLA